MGAVLVLWILATTLGWFAGRVLVLGWLVFGYLIFESVGYVQDRSSSRLARLSAVAAVLILAVAAFVADKHFDL